MSSKFILQESFADFYKKEKALQELKEWYAYDLRCIDRIINEGKIGDFVSGAVSKVKGFAADKLQQAFAKLIQSIIGKDKKKAQEVAAGLQNIQSNPQALQTAAAQGNKLLQGTQQINASYKHDNISFLINSVFTERNLNELFATGILTEARVATNTQPAKQSRSLRPVIKQLTDILNSYKNPQIRKNTLDNFISKVNKKITPQQTQTQPQAKQGQQPQGQQPQAQQAQGQQPQAQQAQQAQGQQAQGQQGQQPQGQQPQGQQPQAQQGQQGQQGQQPQAQQGLFQKAMAWVKANPNMTAGAVIGLVSAIALATGGTAVLIPLIYKGLTGGAIGAGVNAIGQKAAGGNVDWKKAGAAGLKGAAAGMALGGLAKAASGVVHAFQGSGGSGSTDATHGAAHSSSGNNQMNYQNDIAKEAGLTKGQQFELRQGIPFDKNGNQLVDDETVKKIADKYQITTKLHGHVMSAAEKEAYDKSPTGF